MESAVTERTPPATWPQFFLDLAIRAGHRMRGLRAADQPAWARPALLVITAAAALWYAWQASRPVNIEIYYAASARSMTAGLSNFFFGAFDPAGTITVDKLPGAFWLQAISVGVFGAHRWALVLPQVIEGTLTVPVLYHAVRRLAGPVSGLAAAGIVAMSPATIAFDRGNVSDTLMIALVALEHANAADPYLMATQTAVLAAPFIWASGQEVLPIGGFTGTIPEPTLATVQHLVKTGFVSTFLQSPTTTDPRLTWVARHCLDVSGRARVKAALPLAVFYCFR